MPAYNTVKIVDSGQTVTVQFKYGEVWQHEYKIGESIKWGDNNTGIEGAEKVVVYGMSEPSTEQQSGKEYEILIVHNRIVDVSSISEGRDFSGDRNYIIVEKGDRSKEY